MGAQFQKGDRVRWRSHGGYAEGEVLEKITSDTEAEGHACLARPAAVPGAQYQERGPGGAQAGRAGEDVNRRDGLRLAGHAVT